MHNVGLLLLELADQPNHLQEPGSIAASLFTAVQDQLGLRLEASTDLVDALVIDRVEPPTPN